MDAAGLVSSVRLFPLKSEASILRMEDAVECAYEITPTSIPSFLFDFLRNHLVYFNIIARRFLEKYFLRLILNLLTSMFALRFASHP